MLFPFIKKVYKCPYILEVLNIYGVHMPLGRLAELFNGIQEELREDQELEFRYLRFILSATISSILLETTTIPIGTRNISRRCLKGFLAWY